MLLGDFVERVVLENATPRHVAAAGLAFAPRGDALKHGQLHRLAQAHLQALPCIFRVDIVRLARFEHGHLVGQPACAALPLQLGFQMRIDIAQMSDIGERVIELLFGERAAAPVGEAGGLVDLHILDAADQLVIGHAVAKAADHRSHLGVEDRMRDQPAEMEDDLDILPRGMEDLDDIGVGHQREKRSEIEPGRLRIDDHGQVGPGHLDQAELRQASRSSAVVLIIKLQSRWQKYGFSDLDCHVSCLNEKS